MKRLALIGVAILVLLGGCFTPGRPKNLFQRIVTLDFGKTPVERVEQARAGDAKAKEELLGKAHEAAFATNEAIGEIPGGPEQELASKFSDETMGALDVALGALEPRKKAELLSMLEGMKQPADTKLGLKAQAEFIRWQATVAETAAIKREWEADKAKWEARSSDWAKERDAIAKKWESMWFWIWVGVGLYVLIAWVVPVLSKAFPALRGVSMLAQGVIAPGVAMSYHSTRKLLGDVIGGVEEMRKTALAKFPEAKKAADAAMREWVTEADGTAAAVDEIRREKGLI